MHPGRNSPVTQWPLAELVIKLFSLLIRPLNQLPHLKRIRRFKLVCCCAHWRLFPTVRETVNQSELSKVGLRIGMSLLLQSSLETSPHPCDGHSCTENPVISCCIGMDWFHNCWSDRGLRRTRGEYKCRNLLWNNQYCFNFGWCASGTHRLLEEIDLFFYFIFL